MDQNYTVVVERDLESGWLAAEVVELPGCYSEALDLPTLETNIREAIAAYLDAGPPADIRPEFVETWRVCVPA